MPQRRGGATVTCEGGKPWSVDGTYRLTYEPDEIVPIEEWLRPLARFAHLLRPENAHIVREIQRQVRVTGRRS